MQELSGILVSASPRSALFKAALCEALVVLPFKPLLMKCMNSKGND